MAFFIYLFFDILSVQSVNPILMKNKERTKGNDEIPASKKKKKRKKNLIRKHP